MIIDQLFTRPIFEAADPSRLIVSIIIQPMSSGGEPMQKEIDLTGQFQGSTASQMNQAMDYMSKMLESKGLAFNDLQVHYQGHTITGQNRGAMAPQSDWEREAEAKAAQMRGQRSKQTAQPSIKENKSDPITQFASNAHEQWRRNFDPTGTKPRIKKNSDGTEGDINVPFADLHPDWQKENLAAGHAAHRAVKHFGHDMEKAAEYVHSEWMKRNPKADYNAAQHVPYDDLSDDEKEKDRVHVRTMMRLMGHHPKQGVDERIGDLRKFSHKKNRFRSLDKLQNPLGEEDAIDPSRRGFLKKAAGAAVAGAAMSAAGPEIATLVKGFVEQAGGMNGIQALKAMLKIATADELYNMYDYQADSGILADAITDSDMRALQRVRGFRDYEDWSDFEEYCEDNNDVDPVEEFERLTGRSLKVSLVNDILEKVDDTWSLENFFDEYPDALKLINPFENGSISRPTMQQLAHIDKEAKGASLPAPIVAMANAVSGLVRQIFKSNGQPLAAPQQSAVQHARHTPALPAPTRPEFDITPDLKQKEKVPVQRQGDDEEQGVTEAAQGHTIEAHGVRGMDRRTWHKTFRDTEQMMAWAEKHDAEIIGTRDLEQARHHNLSPARQDMAEGLIEMDKSEPSAGRDTGPREGPEKIAKPITKEKMVKHALDTLAKSMDKKDNKKKNVKEGLVDSAMGVSLKLATPELLKLAQFIKAYIKAEAPDALPAMEEILSRLRFYSTQETGKYNIGALQNLHQLAIFIKGNLRPDSEVQPFLTEFIRIVKWYLDETIKLTNENNDPLMKKLRRALVREGRVKELADDLKAMSDADFMKKYGKAKAAIRKDMKRVDEKLTTSDPFAFPAAKASSGRAIDDPDIMGSLKSASEPKFDRFSKTSNEPKLDFRAGITGDDETEVAPEPNPYMQSWGGKYATGGSGEPQWRYVEKGEDPARYGSDTTVSGTGTPDWRSIAASSKSAAAPIALDPGSKNKYKFDRTTQSQVPADGSGANPNIDDATRDRARAWAAQQNAPGAALAGAMRSSGNPVDTAKSKTDWRTIYNLNKSIIGDNPNSIRPGMKLKMPDGSTYRVQPGDNLSKIAAGQINELSTTKLAQYKTAAAKDAQEADKEGDFKRGDKRFRGMVQATKKQFDNDAKQVDENYQSLTEANYLGWLMKLKDMILKIFKSKVKPTVPSSADARFQQMMGKITEPIDPSRLQNLYQEYKSNPQYYLPTPTPRDSPETLRYWTASLADFVMNKFPNADHDVLGDLGGNLATLAVKESLRAVKENVSKVSESRAARRALMARIVNGG